MHYMNVTTLTCVEFEHAQLKQHVAQLGVVKRRGREKHVICSTPGHFQVPRWQNKVHFE